MHPRTDTDRRVAVLVDCDNTSPEILEHALRAAEPSGTIVMRRGYGNPATLCNRWQEALVRLAFTPCLTYQFASGKNTADIALALDALEALLDGRADIFCLVTSDSDFAHLCRKLRERGASVLLVGEAKTPAALRNASSRFVEWKSNRTETPASNLASAVAKPAKPTPPAALVAAIAQLAADTPKGCIGLSALGQYLKTNHPTFSWKAQGHKRLLDMVQACPELLAAREGTTWTVGARARAPAGVSPPHEA